MAKRHLDIMKNKKTIQNIIVLLLVIIAGVWLDRCSKSADETRLHEGDFAIGYIDKYTYRIASGTSTGFYYHFSYNDKKFHYFNDKGIAYSLESCKLPPKNERKKIKPGDMFLVIFDDDGSRLFYNYPIKDSTDFKRYVDMIQHERQEMTN